MGYHFKTWSAADHAAREFIAFDAPTCDTSTAETRAFDDYADNVEIRFQRANLEPFDADDIETHDWRVAVRITADGRCNDYDLKQDGTFTRQRIS